MQNHFTSGSLRPRVRFCGCKDRKYFSNYNGLRINFFKTFSLFATFGISTWHFSRVKVQKCRIQRCANSFNLNLKDPLSHPTSHSFSMVPRCRYFNQFSIKMTSKNSAKWPKNDVQLLFLAVFCIKSCKQLKLSIYLHTKHKKRLPI